MQLTRRDVLIGSALLTRAHCLAATKPNLRFPTAARDRIAVASYSFRGSIDTPRNRARNPQATLIDLKEFPALVAERYKIRNVELLGQHLQSTEPAYLKELLVAVKSAGSNVVNIPTGVGASMYDPDPGKRATAVENSKRWIDAAVALECPSVRIHIQGVKGAAQDLALTAETLAPICQFAASRNVIVNLENDDPGTEHAPFLAKLIDRVNSPWLRALPDFCNSMLGANPQFNYDAVASMFARAYNICHVKDSEVDNGKVVRVDLERTFAIVRTSGYKGYFSIEFEGEGDPYVEVGKLIDQSLKYLA
jgi:sugar phosphate isomerase/epimerase